MVRKKFDISCVKDLPAGYMLRWQIRMIVAGRLDVIEYVMGDYYAAGKDVSKMSESARSWLLVGDRKPWW